MLDLSVRCDVYRNLKKPAVTYSIRQRGKVVGYTGKVVLRDCEFKHASPEQQSNCRQRRLVCQWVKGFVTDAVPDAAWVRVACDPKQVNGFCRQDTGERIDRARFIHLCEAGCFAVL